MQLENIAILDLGTNTFHLLIASLSEKNVHVISREKIPVKIGEGGIGKRFITKSAQLRAVEAVKKFSAIIQSAGVTEIHAYATSAIRSAANGARLIRDIFNETGIVVKEIRGSEEAQLIYYGVRQAVELGDQLNLIMDIGGGSVEFIIANAYTVLWKKSFEIGAQRLTDKFHRHDPVRNTDVVELNRYLERELKTLKSAIQKFKPAILVGASGTFDTFIELSHHKAGIKRDRDSTEHKLSLKAFYEIYDQLIRKNREDRLAIPGMAEMRVDMIVMSTILTHFVISNSGITRIKTSSYSLKEGILYSILEKKQVKKLSA